MGLPAYSSPLGQVVIVGFILFCTSGMFNALNGMGGGGQMDDSVVSKSNTALYACFAVSGVLAGGINNILGPKILMFSGSLTYALYVGAFLAYSHIQSVSFAVTAGAILGIGAGLLWTAQGAIMMSYPTEDHKGQFITVFWIIFNLGGVLGGLIPFGLNYNSKAGTVSDGTYIAFLILMCLGSLLTLTLISPKKMTRDDGTPVILEKSPGVVAEAIGILSTFADWRMLCLTPLFLSSNWFYGYQFNGINSFLFNIRTRGLNNVFYWGAQMFGVYLFGRFLDSPNLIRSKRAVYSLIGFGSAFLIVWGGGLALQLQYDRHDAKWDLDFQDSSRAGGPIILYLLFGMFDAILQSWCYWIMGALTNDASTLARFAGYYKGIQSAGGAIAWAIDAGGVSYVAQLGINWGLLAFALVPAFLVARNIKDTSNEEYRPTKPAPKPIQHEAQELAEV